MNVRDSERTRGGFARDCARQSPPRPAPGGVLKEPPLGERFGADGAPHRDGARHGSRWPRLSDRGASAVEYALLLGLIAVVVFAAVSMMGLHVRELYSSIATGY